VDRSVAVSLLLNYPRGALYETDGSEGVLLTEPILVRAQTPYDYAAMGAVLIRGAARWSLDSRIEIWTQAVARVKGASWTGVGLNHFRHLYKPHRSVDTGLLSEAPHAHNLPLQVTLDLGLPGLLVYTALAVWLFLRSWQAASGPDALARGVGLAAMLGLVAIHAFGVTDAIALGAKVGLLQWFAAGLGVAAFQLQQPA
jgi:putative inorganic carbon (HCO3(-)) transporter